MEQELKEFRDATFTSHVDQPDDKKASASR